MNGQKDQQEAAAAASAMPEQLVELTKNKEPREEAEEPEEEVRSINYRIKLAASLCAVILVIVIVVVVLIMGNLIPGLRCTTGFDMPPANQILDNGYVRVGVDYNEGGAISYVAPSNDPQNNLINVFDKGRHVQMSFFAGPQIYNPDGKCDKLFNGYEWSWNPIGAGDVDGGVSQILNFERSVGQMSILTRPLQWACHGVPCECTFDKHIQVIDGNPAVKVTATLRNERTDEYDENEAKGQELPAVYTNGGFHRLFTYRGASPFAPGEPVEEIHATFENQFWVPGFFRGTENWAAMINDDGWGLGVISPEHDGFLGGFSDPGKRGCGGPRDGQAGYIAVVESYALPRDIVFTYEFYLVVGTVDQIRSYAQRVMTGDESAMGNPPPDAESSPEIVPVPEIVAVPLPLPLNSNP
ncbi:expressed unknown protein [Seminavis robusta]|uniref:Uncharacterized protein n=1 Tax=Seminavis robusta TaxID=568900 RepID=A0A9N8HDF3_9STRA|nr:expressed unknown protein [Seminavis robusta]|eukprot:Sro425_g140190.1 n/a (412) ;mRNA; r:44552-45787